MNDHRKVSKLMKPLVGFWFALPQYASAEHSESIRHS